MEQRTSPKFWKSTSTLYIVSHLILFNFYVEYIMQNARLDESQAGIKIAGRNINNLRHVDDTIVTAENEEELKSLLMKVKEESEKAVLKLNIKKTRFMVSGPNTSWQIDEETMQTGTDFIFLDFKITMDSNCSNEIKRHLLLGRKAMTNIVKVKMLISHPSTNLALMTA